MGSFTWFDCLLEVGYCLVRVLWIQVLNIKNLMGRWIGSSVLYSERDPLFAIVRGVMDRG